MHGSYLMKTFESIEHLFEVPYSMVLTKVFFFFEVFIHIFSIAVLKDDKDAISSLEDIMTFDDILVIALFKNMDLCFD
jgi:hypothetical protein